MGVQMREWEAVQIPVTKTVNERERGIWGGGRGKREVIRRLVGSKCPQDASFRCLY